MSMNGLIIKYSMLHMYRRFGICKKLVLNNLVTTLITQFTNNGLNLLFHHPHRETSLHLPPLCKLMTGNLFFPAYFNLGPRAFKKKKKTHEFQFVILCFISLYGLYWHLPFKTLVYWVCIFLIFL